MDDKELDDMAKDIEPIEEPKEEAKTEAPSGFVEDKETYVKPNGETTVTPERTPTVIKEESGAKKWVMGGFITILILGLGAASAWLYTDAQKARNELQSVKTGLDKANADAAKLRDEVAKAKIDEAPVAKATTKELADDTVKAYKEAATGTSYFVRLEKAQDNFVSIYMKPEANGAEPSLVILKKVNNQLVEIERVAGANKLSKDEAASLMEVFGVDVKALGVSVE